MKYDRLDIAKMLGRLHQLQQLGVGEIHPVQFFHHKDQYCTSMLCVSVYTVLVYILKVIIVYTLR